MSDINITVNDEIVNIDVIDEPVLVNVVNSPGQQGPAGPGVPVGGTTGQVLKKLSGTNYDTYWAADAAGVSSVGLSMPSAFSVANSPITSAGTLAVTGSGSTTQYIDGTGGLQTFPLTLPVLQEVRNQTGATLDAGTVVYINGATGNKPTVTKAIATGDATSAQTLGMISSAIANNGVGYVVVIGTCGGLDTSAYTEGQQLYLSGTVAGGVTTTKPYAPIHLVYVGIVTRAHPNLGTIEVRVQNGIEVDEIHNVSAQTPSNNDGLFYNTSTSLWESKSITTALGYTPVPTTRNITINGVTYDLSADRTWTIAAGISGSGAAGQVTYWTGASAVSGSNNLFWDNTNGRLGIGTNAPAYPLHIVTSSRFGFVYECTDATANQNYVFLYRNSSTPANADNLGTFLFEGNNASLARVTYGYFGSRIVSTTAGSHSGDIYFATTNAGVEADKLLLKSNGNLILQNGGTFTDGGQRLQVIGDTLLRGSGATSATTALTVQNSSSTNLFRVLNDGFVYGGYVNYVGQNSTNPLTFSFVDGAFTSPGAAGRNFGYFNSNTTQTGDQYHFALSGNTITATSGTHVGIYYSRTFAPTSGSGIFSATNIAPIINQVGATGITRGLYVNPTLTSAADFRAIETARGNIVFSNLPTSSAGLPSGALWNNGGVINIV